MKTKHRKPLSQEAKVRQLAGIKMYWDKRRAEKLRDQHVLEVSNPIELPINDDELDALIALAWNSLPRIERIRRLVKP
jgi:hypothetical protein